jgi:hypothetical protein
MVAQQRQERPQVDFFERQPKPIPAFLSGAAWPLEQVIEITQQVRRAIDQIEVSATVKSTKGRVGQLQYVNILDCGMWSDLTESQFNCLSGAHMSSAHGSRQDENSRG